jgi:hypothetical protein
LHHTALGLAKYPAGQMLDLKNLTRYEIPLRNQGGSLIRHLLSDVAIGLLGLQILPLRKNLNGILSREVLHSPSFRNQAHLLIGYFPLVGFAQLELRLAVQNAVWEVSDQRLLLGHSLELPPKALVLEGRRLDLGFQPIYGRPFPLLDG